MASNPRYRLQCDSKGCNTYHGLVSRDVSPRPIPPPPVYFPPIPPPNSPPVFLPPLFPSRFPPPPYVPPVSPFFPSFTSFSQDKSHDALTSILTEFERLGRPTYHLIGNHCLYNLERPILNDRHGAVNMPGGGLLSAAFFCLGEAPLRNPILPCSCRLGIGHGCPSDVSFYSTQPHKSFRIVFADGCVDCELSYDS